MNACGRIATWWKEMMADATHQASEECILHQVYTLLFLAARDHFCDAEAIIPLDNDHLTASHGLSVQ